MAASGENAHPNDRRETAPVPVERRLATLLTPEQLQRRRRRNLAIGLLAGALALLFYAVTIIKLGPGVLNRPL